MQKITFCPHDKFCRSSMSNLRVAREFFETYLPEHIRKRINFSTLELKKDSFIDKNLRSHSSDLLYSVEIDDKPAYLYLLIEHQSTSDPLMPFRLLKYIVLGMDQFLKEHGGEELPLIYPIVLYNGKKPYAHSTDLFTLFNENEALAREVFLQPFHLVDLNEIPDEALKQRTWLGILLLCLKHSVRVDLLRWAESIANSLCIIEQEGGTDYANATFIYLLTTGAVTDLKLFTDITDKHLSPKLEKNMKTIAQQLEERGLQKGLQQGLQQGLQKGLKKLQKEKINIAKKMLASGISLKTITEVTGVSPEML